MDHKQIIYIPIIALVAVAFTYGWNLKVRNRAFKSSEVWFLSLFGSLFNVWGLDVLQRELGVETVHNMVLLSASVWFVFVMATYAKYIPIYGWSKRDFWLDYGGDLISFILSGLLVFAVT